MREAGEELLKVAGDIKFKTVLADPPWPFKNKTGKMAPEHKRLYRYPTMTLEEIKSFPVDQIVDSNAHLYLWIPNALLKEGLEVMESWGFTYKTNIVWYKVRKDGGPDRRGVGFYFRNVTELVLFGVKGNMRTLEPGRSMPNIIVAPKTVHSRKPDELYRIIELCSPEPYIELFARSRYSNWTVWGDETDKYINSDTLFQEERKVLLADEYLK
ncbi:MAG: S-adenosylmethionine-binding protein [Thermotogae bacterium]|nr:MAG: S-adenosylmethionine-binding protein [Thermotogota bacterium]